MTEQKLSEALQRVVDSIGSRLRCPVFGLICSQEDRRMIVDSEYVQSYRDGKRNGFKRHRRGHTDAGMRKGHYESLCQGAKGDGRQVNKMNEYCRSYYANYAQRHAYNKTVRDMARQALKDFDRMSEKMADMQETIQRLKEGSS